MHDKMYYVSHVSKRLLPRTLVQKSIVVCSAIGLLLSSALIDVYASSDKAAAATHITCVSGGNRFSVETPTGGGPTLQIAADQITSSP